ncbi:calcium-binding protein [Phenylobacterium sp.]|jgi:serralysin|uniref:calcium-binding protein n=1 Tax=Phenylobacterium sp. TaxID=1871053 RepID=UPI00378393A1
MAVLDLLYAGGVDMDFLSVASLAEGDVVTANATTFAVTLDDEVVTFYGTGFTYNTQGVPTGGTITRVTSSYLGVNMFDLKSLSVPVQQVVTWALEGDDLGMANTVLGGADTINGSAGGDLVSGFGGANLVNAGGGDDSVAGMVGSSDTVYGGAGNDLIVSESYSFNYFRGEAGDDRIIGGYGFDDLHGNQGNDSVAGNLGDDWVVGGQGSDFLLGNEGFDVVLGNLGADTAQGGAGIDWVRGGQQDDVLDGGLGDDWLSGDRDNDTVTGGAGADTFNFFAEAGVDRVTDFSAADGDKVRLEPGSTYSAAQVGADTVITVGAAQMTLVGVQMNSLGAGWIYVA